MTTVDMVEALKSSRARGEQTRKLANLLTRRLAGREDMSKRQYELIIANNRIAFSPNVKVYPDRYNRKPTDGKPILEFVLTKYFPEAIDKIDGNEIFIQPNVFVPHGHYFYIPSADNRRRKWVALR